MLTSDPTLVLAAVTIGAQAVLGVFAWSVRKLVSDLEGRLDHLDKCIDEARTVSSELREQAHQRHEENVRRLTRIETLLDSCRPESRRRPS